MATTTNYGWTTPDDTDLVKDGASAIRTLGSSVDTTTKALNPSTTLGDIEYRSSTANTNTRLGIGTTGQILTVAGGVPSWATPAAGGGMTSLASGSLSGTTVNLSSISGSYKSLVLFVHEIRVNVATRLYLKLNSSSGTDYSYNLQRSNTATNSFDNVSHMAIFAEDNLPTTSGQTGFVLKIDNYTNTLGYKSYKMNGFNNGGATNANFEGGGVYRSTSAVTAINFTTLSGTATFSGSYTLYGVN